MFYSNDRSALRQQYIEAWQKYHNKQLLSPLEPQIIQVLQDHPEYHDMVMQKQYWDHNFEVGEINPFLHMSMHLSVRDQIALDKPIGTRAIYERLLLKMGDPLLVEHEMMHVLTDYIWQMLKTHTVFNTTAYLERLQQL